MWRKGGGREGGGGVVEDIMGEVLVGRSDGVVLRGRLRSLINIGTAEDHPGLF